MFIILQSSHGMGVAIAIMFVIHKVVKYLIPQLVISIVFAPLKARPIKFQHELGETDTLSWADKPVGIGYGGIRFLI